MYFIPTRMEYGMYHPTADLHPVAIQLTALAAEVVKVLSPDAPPSVSDIFAVCRASTHPALQDLEADPVVAAVSQPILDEAFTQARFSGLRWFRRQQASNIQLSPAARALLNYAAAMTGNRDAVWDLFNAQFSMQ